MSSPIRPVCRETLIQYKNYILCALSFVSYISLTHFDTPPHTHTLHPYIITEADVLTHVSRGAAGRGHDVVVHHLRQAKVADHDLGVLVLAVVQDVLRLRGGQTHRISVHTRSKYHFPCSETNSKILY